MAHTAAHWLSAFTSYWGGLSTDGRVFLCVAIVQALAFLTFCVGYVVSGEL